MLWTRGWTDMKLSTAYCNECAYLPDGDRGNVTLG